MNRARSSELFLALSAAGILALAWHVKRQGRERERQLMSTRDSLSRVSSLQAHDLQYLHRWMRAARIDSSVTLEGATFDQKRTVVRLADLKAPLVLYSINPECSSCFRNLPFINSLAEARSSCSTRVLGVLAADDGSVGRAPDGRLHFQLLSNASGTAWDVLPLVSAPTVIVIAPRGRLGGWWSGELSVVDQADIMRTIASSCADVTGAAAVPHVGVAPG
jgi:hypothetical protein